jgi:hypothetical protein
MKYFIPPLIAILAIYGFDLLVDFIFSLEYDDSGTPGIVFLIEAIMIVIFIIIGYLLHGLVIVKVILKIGNAGYIKILVWGFVIILILSTISSCVVYSDSKFEINQIFLITLRMVITLNVLMIVDLIALRVINK